MKQNKNLSAFSLRLKRLRELRKLSQKEFAAALGIIPATYNLYERNNSQPSIDTIMKMATILDIDINTLFGWKAPDNRVDEVKNILRQNDIMFIDDPIKKEVMISCENDTSVIVVQYDLLENVVLKTENTVRELLKNLHVATFQNDFFKNLQLELYTQQSNSKPKARRNTKGLAINSQIRFLGKRINEGDKIKAPDVPDNLKDGATFYAADIIKAGDK